MPNKNYRKGYRIELIAKKELEANGYSVMRSGGSKGIFDLCAYDFNHFRLIQLKSTKRDSYILKQTIRDIEDVEVPANCRKELWIHKDKKGFIRKEVFA